MRSRIEGARVLGRASLRGMMRDSSYGPNVTGISRCSPLRSTVKTALSASMPASMVCSLEYYAYVFSIRRAFSLRSQ
jgi:hypothetical protein